MSYILTNKKPENNKNYKVIKDNGTLVSRDRGRGDRPVVAMGPPFPQKYFFKE
jgi:hypothetical protein